MSYKILVTGAGGSKGLSGVHENLFQALSKKHNLIDVLDSSLTGFWKYYNYLYCFLRFPGSSKYLHPIHTIQSNEFNSYRMRAKYYVLKRTTQFENKLKNFSNYDLILQTSWLPAIMDEPRKPRYVYIDYTLKLAEQEYPKWARFLSHKDRDFWIKSETKTFENATRVFTFSKKTRNSVIEDYKIDEDKVTAVYSGVNLQALPDFEKGYDNRTILFVGKEFERKGGESLLRAFKELNENTKGVNLIVVGSHPQINEPGVIVKGQVNRNELLQLYKEASVFVMPSLCDPFPNVFMEAMAYKTPCIGSNVSGIPEIIKDGETGFMVPPNDHKQLADRLIQLLEDENLMKSMGEKGRERVEKYFTWDLVVDRMTEQFEKDLNDK